MGALEKNGESTRKGWYWNEKAAIREMWDLKMEVIKKVIEEW